MACPRALVIVLTFGLLVASTPGRAASEHYGQVTFGTVPVPGATVTASQGDKEVVTSTDQRGVYRFADLADGSWILKVEMIGFSPLSQDVTVAPDSPPAMWDLRLRPLDEMAREARQAEPQGAPPSPSGSPTGTAASRAQGSAPPTPARTQP